MKITLHLLKLSQKLGWVPVFWPTRYRAKQSSHCKKIRDLKSPKYTDRSIHNTCQETVDDGKVWSHTIAIGSIFLCWHAKTFSIESSTVKSTAMKLHNTIMRLHVLSASLISHCRFLQLTFLYVLLHSFSFAMIYLHLQLNYDTCGPILLTIANIYTVYTVPYTIGLCTKKAHWGARLYFLWTHYTSVCYS